MTLALLTDITNCCSIFIGHNWKVMTMKHDGLWEWQGDQAAGASK